ncbi:MAG: hypothetical protein ACJ71T_12085 [Actinomycetales bacterium]
MSGSLAYELIELFPWLSWADAHSYAYKWTDAVMQERHDIIAWMLQGGLSLDDHWLAAKLASAGVRPKEASLRLWYGGIVSATKAPLSQTILRVDPEDIRGWLTKYRHSQSRQAETGT